MKILFLAANPQSTNRLNLGKEVQEIEEGLRRSRLSDKFQLSQRWEVRPRDLRRALLEENPDIVHFSGHGKGKAGLVIVDRTEQPKPATGEALAGLFRQFPNIKCVLLNACYAEVQAQAIVQHIDYVIGMKDTILDDAAIAFTTGFYDGLGYGRNIEDAFELGRNAIVWEQASFSDTTRQMIPVDLVETEFLESLPEHFKPILLKKADNLNQGISNQSKESKDVPIQNPSQLYRERVKEYLAQRILNPIAKFQLATLAKQLGMSESEANKILQAELHEIEQAKENYRTVLKQTIEQGCDLSNPQIQHQLKELQTSLNLIDSEAEEISRLILAQAETEDREIKLEKFSFEVITVNDRGEENSRTTKEAEFFREDLGNGIALEMVAISGGEFLMGTEDKEIARLIEKFGWGGFKRESPQHLVKIKPFFIGKYPITQAQWQAIMGNNPSSFQGNFLNKNPFNPVERVSWDDAQEFCQRLSQQTGTEYRLPSEAEWEYAARAGTSSPFYFGATITSNLANYNGNHIYAAEAQGKYRKQTTKGGIFPPNSFGLYDLHGNVWEWCEDDWHQNYNSASDDGTAWSSGNSSYKVIRGGSWDHDPGDCRSACRGKDSRGHRDDSVGFRVVCVAGRTT